MTMTGGGLQLRGSAILSLLFVAASGMAVAAETCPSAAVARAGNSAPALVAETNAGNWVRVNGAAFPVNSVVRFVYVGRRSEARERSEGALAVRISRQVDEGNSGPAAATVTMRRPVAGSSCGFGALIWRDYTLAQSASVDDFIQYHLQTSSNSNVIRNYHISYRSPHVGCVRTDARAGDRRTAFLAETDGPPARTGAVVAEGAGGLLTAVSSALFGSAVASSAPPVQAQKRASGKLRDDYAKERKAFASFAAVESQIHTYDLGGRACASFAPPVALGAKPGAKWTIAVVDLDGGDTGAGRRQTFTISWR